jgi:pectate lyase
MGGTTGTGGMSTTGITCTPQTWDAAPIGWASTSGGTTGGGSATPVTVTTLAQLNSVAGGSGAAVIHVSGKVAGTVKVGSNKTILGLCGAEVDGSLNLTDSTNVVVRNLKVVGFNCTDSPSDCSAGADAVHVEGGSAQHLWFDHMDISDGSDGNLDITNGADLITVSWTKFSYSGRRTDPVAGANGHRFSNLIGAADTVTSDAGHLSVTWHHVWWADNVNQRMPRVRFGKVQVFNSLYTAVGDSACIEVGVSCNIRSENNVFQGVSNTVDSSHSNGASIIQSIGDLGSNTNIGGAAFTPPYAYTLDPASSVPAAVMAGAGPH